MEHNKKFKFCLKGASVVSFIWSILFIPYFYYLDYLTNHYGPLDDPSYNPSFSTVIGAAILMLILLITVRAFSILMNRSRKAGKDFVTKKIIKDPEKLKAELEKNKTESMSEKVFNFFTDQLILDDVSISTNGAWKYIGIAFFIFILYFFGLDNPFEPVSNLIFIFFLLLFFNEGYRSIFVPGGLIGLSYSFICCGLLVFGFFSESRNYKMIIISILTYLLLLVFTRISRKVFVHIERDTLRPSPE